MTNKIQDHLCSKVAPSLTYPEETKIMEGFYHDTYEIFPGNNSGLQEHAFMI